jgi:chitin synthase
LFLGPVVWYQQFEYATSQWLQKTTEQVIGSVLCSPGCFSLYRADALLHHKVIGKYSRKPEEAMECLKYDQGEDRWLCTLMLKAGYRM